MTAPSAHQEVTVAYPSRVFEHSKEGLKSKKYVERYLDATKSNMLFVKGVIFVEGIAEQILMPCFAEYLGSPLEAHHVAVVAVSGVTFKHFLPIFGAGVPEELRPFALLRPVVCLIDADPARVEKKNGAKRTTCWPYQLDRDTSRYEYFPESATLVNLRQQCQDASHIIVCCGQKTLEYDLATENYKSNLLVTPACTHAEALRQLATTPAEFPHALRRKLDQGSDTLIADIGSIADPEKQQQARFATCYLLCTEDRKGEHAFDLAFQLRENLSKPDCDRVDFQVPNHIEQSIRWACGEKIQESTL